MQTEKTKWEPGPWRIGYGGMEGDTHAVITSPGGTYAVCVCEPLGYNPANARLIAAAPALAAALRMVCEASDDNGDMNDIDWKMIRAALAQAEGGAE